MAEMTKEDWQKKDDLTRASIVSQSCLERAVELVTKFCNGLSLEGTKQELSDIYDFLCDLVVNKTQELASPGEKLSVVPEPVVPEPTDEQTKALKKVLEETNWTKEQVYEEFHKYPSLDKADICIKAIKMVKRQKGD